MLGLQFMPWTLNQLVDVDAACTAVQRGIAPFLVSDMVLIYENKTVVADGFVE